MENDIIRIENISYKYRSSSGVIDKSAIDGIDLNIKEGEFVAILGRNGSGKSTIAKHINALILPDSGKVYVDNIDTSLPGSVYDVRSKAGMVFQNPDNQIVATIVEEEVAFGPENLGVLPSEIKKRVAESLKIVDMSDYLKSSTSALSGGQKQRVAIAGVLAMNPKCIVFDEPTAMLDPSGRKEVMENIKKINKEDGITIILITHYMEEATEADTVVVVDNGKIVLQGTPREVFSNVEKVKSFGLDVPQVIELSYELKNSGFDIDTDILDVDEMVNAICQLK